jgi:Co/Zn/Cd efflux system component
MQRAELLGGLINSILLMSTAIFITIAASKILNFNSHSVPKFFDPEKVNGGIGIIIITGDSFFKVNSK